MYIYIYIYGIGVKSGPHGAAASATCQGKKDKMKIIFKLYKSMLLQPLNEETWSISNDKSMNYLWY